MVMAIAPDTYWMAFCSAQGLPPGTPHRVRRLGDDPATCRLLLELIRAGKKTGTFALAEEFTLSGESIPAVGEYLVLTDFDGRPDCIVRLTAVITKPFDDITTDDVSCEGPGLRDLAAWRKLHWAYWGRKLERLGRAPRHDMAVLCQRFELTKE
jgi:uncharacterized protein YhfF